MNQCTIDTEIDPSKAFNDRKIKVRWAQGQASETYRWYLPGEALNPSLPEGPADPSAVTQLRKRLPLRTNDPSVVPALWSIACQRPSITDPITLSWKHSNLAPMAVYSS